MARKDEKNEKGMALLLAPPVFVPVDPVVPVDPGCQGVGPWSVYYKT